ncbi:MAG: hypothetical protein IJF08_06620, partial [Clostridia bacterium]|nr:hypothetical protein [Clostridia bacterium]
MENQAKTKELSLGILWKVFRARILWLVLALVIGMGGAFCYTQFVAVPSYSSSAKLMVQNLGDSEATMQSAYLQGAERIAQGYAEKLNGNVFLEQVAEAYNKEYGKNLTFGEVRSKMTATAQEESSVIRVTVVSTDPKEAYDLIQTVEKLAVVGLNDSEIYEVNLRVSLIDRGLLDKAPDSPNLAMNLLLGGAAAFLIAYVVFFLIYMLDRTVYGEDEIKEQFNLPIVGQIPEWLNEGESAQRKLRKRILGRKAGDAKEPRRTSRDYKDRLLSKDTPFWITEAFKTLRTNLAYATTGDTKCPIFGITSDFTSAGKSLIAANLAVSFAQLGKKVLLIDGDMRCPVQHLVFGVDKKQYGLSEA